MKILKKTLAFCLPIIVIVLLPPLQSHSVASNDEVGIHGMLVIGDKVIYISHLPMFTVPHRFQAIWEITFGAEGDETYRNSRGRGSNDKSIYTINPTEKFALKELDQGKKSFRADVYVGHFERAGHTVLLENVEVKLLRQIHFHQLEVGVSRPEEFYVLFGQTADSVGKSSDNAELYLAHGISVAPSYDQVLRICHLVAPQAPVSRSGRPLLEQGARIVLSDRKDTDILQVGETAEGVIQVMGPEASIRHKGPVKFEVCSEYYLEQQELIKSELR